MKETRHRRFFLVWPLFLLFLVACNTTTGYVLPDLTGKTEAEAMAAFSGIPVTLVALTEANENVETGFFSRYEEDMESGDPIQPGAVVRMFFALNNPKLPDLIGKTESEISEILDELGIDYQFSIETNNDVDDMTFSRYGNPYSPGDEITNPENLTVMIYLGANDPILPDLSGLDVSQIEPIMTEAFLMYHFEYAVNDLLPEDTFSGYGAGYEAGDFFDATEVVTIYLVKNTFTDATESLFISKYVDGGTNTDNQAIEIFNPTNESILLSEFFIKILFNGSYEGTRISLPETTLAPNEAFVIVNAAADAELLEKADLTSTSLTFDGNDCVQLCFENGTYIDTIYQLGNKSFTMNDEVFIRIPTVEVGTRDFNFSQWTAYIPTYFDSLGTHPVSIPTLLEFVFVDRPFMDALGGMDLVTLDYVYDGDTAGFTPGFTADKRVRFLGVDTPETYPIEDDWGPEAKSYTTAALQSALVIYLQSDVDSGYTDNYGRTLGLVWIDGVLLNYELVRLGYTHNYLGSECKLIYGNRYLYRWFQDAEAEAEAAERGIHS
jgi:endonuclease YncB( thermonuclease family)